MFLVIAIFLAAQSSVTVFILNGLSSMSNETWNPRCWWNQWHNINDTNPHWTIWIIQKLLIMAYEGIFILSCKPILYFSESKPTLVKIDHFSSLEWRLSGRRINVRKNWFFCFVLQHLYKQKPLLVFIILSCFVWFFLYPFFVSYSFPFFPSYFPLFSFIHLCYFPAFWFDG